MVNFYRMNIVDKSVSLRVEKRAKNGLITDLIFLGILQEVTQEKVLEIIIIVEIPMERKKVLGAILQIQELDLNTAFAKVKIHEIR